MWTAKEPMVRRMSARVCLGERAGLGSPLSQYYSYLWSNSQVRDGKGHRSGAEHANSRNMSVPIQHG